MNLQEVRDIVIIVAGSMMVLVLFALFVFTVVVGLATRALLGAVRTLVRAEVTPLVHSSRQTLDTVQGTATFISETAVSPIIRFYSIFAAIRRALSVLLGLAGRLRRR